MPETDARPAPIVTPSGRRGRRHGIEIKAGSVKQARKEAGLSLAKVANGAVSRTAIYFVEVGKAKPSMETLMLIAERTGRPLDYFLAQPSTLEPRSSPQTLEIELLMATNDLQGALATGRALLAAELDPETKARAQHLVAYALLRTAQPVEARRLAVAARAYFEKIGDSLMTAECLGHVHAPGPSGARTCRASPGALPHPAPGARDNPGAAVVRARIRACHERRLAGRHRLL